MFQLLFSIANSSAPRSTARAATTTARSTARARTRQRRRRDFNSSLVRRPDRSRSSVRWTIASRRSLPTTPGSASSCDGHTGDHLWSSYNIGNTRTEILFGSDHDGELWTSAAHRPRHDIIDFVLLSVHYTTTTIHLHGVGAIETTLVPRPRPRQANREEFHGLVGVRLHAWLSIGLC